MWITSEGKKMEDIFYCFVHYPQFRDDIDVLFREGIIKHIAFNQYDWKKSRTSLAEYFHWVGINVSNVVGGHWAPVAKSITVKGKPVTRSQLTNLLYKQIHKTSKSPVSSDSDEFKEIKNTVIKYRAELAEIEKQKREWEVFHKNFEEWLNEKHRIIHEYFELPIHERETPETIRNISARFDEAYKILKSGEKIT